MFTNFNSVMPNQRNFCDPLSTASYLLRGVPSDRHEDKNTLLALHYMRTMSGPTFFDHLTQRKTPDDTRRLELECVLTPPLPPVRKGICGRRTPSSSAKIIKWAQDVLNRRSSLFFESCKRKTRGHTRARVDTAAAAQAPKHERIEKTIGIIVQGNRPQVGVCVGREGTTRCRYECVAFLRKGAGCLTSALLLESGSCPPNKRGSLKKPLGAQA